MSNIQRTHDKAASRQRDESRLVVGRRIRYISTQRQGNTRGRRCAVDRISCAVVKAMGSMIFVPQFKWSSAAPDCRSCLAIQYIVKMYRQHGCFGAYPNELRPHKHETWMACRPRDTLHFQVTKKPCISCKVEAFGTRC